MGLTVPKDNGPVTGVGHDQGKGTLTLPPDNGDLIGEYGHNIEKWGEFTAFSASVRGVDTEIKDAGNMTGFQPGAPVWLEGRGVDTDDTNSLGKVPGTESDPMFERMAREDRPGPDKNRETTTEPAESVAASDLGKADTGSDAEEEEFTKDSDFRKGSGQIYNPV